MRFTIRELVLVTIIVATLLAWAIDHWRLASTIEHLRELVPFKHPESAYF
jgi:hypothetical protein